MKEKIYGKATEYIESLASSLGVAAEHVYGILVRQQIAEGITTLIIFGVIYAVLGTIVGIAVKKSDFRYDFISNYVVILGSVVLVIVSAFAIFELRGAIMQLINPEYYAIKEIMDVIKGATE